MYRLFVSGWKRLPGKGGICQYVLGDSGELSMVDHVEPELSFNVTLADEKKGILYALNESPDQPGMRFGGGGSIYIINIDPESGRIAEIDQYPAYCSNPCNVAVSPDGNNLIVTGHGSKAYVTKLVQDGNGSFFCEVLTDDTPVVLFKRNANGTPGKVLDAKMHVGSGPKKNQLTAHPHSAVFTPSGNMFAVCDKGMDCIFMYRIENDGSGLECLNKTFIEKGQAPRYSVFHQNLPFLYFNTEGSSLVHIYKYDDAGNLSPVGTVDSLEKDYGNRIEQQGFCLHPNGEYLYDAVNGANVIAVFKVSEDGEPTLVQNFETGYIWPRGIAVSPDGKYLAAAFVESKKLVIYEISEEGLIASEVSSFCQDNAAYVTFWNT